MPPRREGGWFRRVLDALGDLLSFGREEPPEPPEPSPVSPPKRRERDREPSPEERLDRGMRDVWDADMGGPGYHEWRNMFESFSILFDSPEEETEGFDLFLRAFGRSSSDPGSVSREEFTRAMALPMDRRGAPEPMDWEMWRRISRTA